MSIRKAIAAGEEVEGSNATQASPILSKEKGPECSGPLDGRPVGELMPMSECNCYEHEGQEETRSNDGLGSAHVHAEGGTSSGLGGPGTGATRRQSFKGSTWDPFYFSIDAAERAVGQYRQVIRCWVPVEGVTFIVAQRSMGKTTVLIDQGLTIATDRPDWYGYPVDPGYWVVYLCGESATTAGEMGWTQSRTPALCS